MIATAVTIVGFANDGVGFIVGVAVSAFLYCSRKNEKKKNDLM